MRQARLQSRGGWVDGDVVARLRLSLPVGLLVLVAMSAVGGHVDAATSRGWQRVDLHAVTQPRAVGHRFVLYAAKGGELQVVALDAISGTTAWSVAASPSIITPGVAPSVAAIGGDVFYLRTAAAGGAELVARDVATGE